MIFKGGRINNGLTRPVTEIVFGICENNLNRSSWYMTAVGIKGLGGLGGYTQSPSSNLSQRLTGVRISETAKTCKTHASRWNTH